MAKEHTYYMPYGAHDFVIWARNFLEMARANAAGWGLKPADLDGMALLLTDLEAKIALAESEKATKIDIQAKKPLLQETRAAFRQYVNSQINFNTKISDFGRTILRVHVRDTTRTPIERPAGRVLFQVRVLHGHDHRIDFVDEASGKKKIAYGLTGAVLHSKILEADEAAPLSGDHLPSDELMTSTPHIMEYGPEHAGKRVAYAAAWQNEKGEKGEFSDVQTVIIP